MQYEIKISNLWKFLFLFLAIIISYIVSHRGPYVDYDYQSYKEMFYSFNSINVEPTFKLIALVFQNFENGFVYLLFVFCFLSLYLKLLSVLNAKNNKQLSDSDLFYFILFYFICFFGLWDLTQIRASIAVSFFIFSLFIFNRFNKVFFTLLAVLSHYSLFIVVVFETIFRLVKRNIFIYIFVVLIFSYLIKTIIGMTSYNVYNASTYKEVFSILSFKNLYIVSSFMVVLFFTNFFRNDSKQLLMNFSAISIGLFVLYLVVGVTYPSVAIRIADFSLFFAIFAFVFSRGNFYLNMYRFITLIILSIYFIDVLYLDSNSVIKLDAWGR